MASTICSHSVWLLENGVVCVASVAGVSVVCPHKHAEQAPSQIGAVTPSSRDGRPCRRMREVRRDLTLASRGGGWQAGRVVVGRRLVSVGQRVCDCLTGMPPACSRPACANAVRAPSSPRRPRFGHRTRPADELLAAIGRCPPAGRERRQRDRLRAAPAGCAGREGAAAEDSGFEYSDRPGVLRSGWRKRQPARLSV